MTDQAVKATQKLIESGIDVVSAYGLSVIGGIVLLVVGWIVAGAASRTTRRALSRTESVDETLRGFFASLVRYVVLAVVVIGVLNQFGVQTASLIAVLGAAGLAIGLAMQGTLSNVAAGIMLLIFRPFKVGQYVQVAGHGGTVRELSLFTTELATPDNVQIIIPNASVWGASVVNYSHHETRRVDFTLGIAYGDDIEQAMSVVKQQIDADPRPLADPEPQIVVGELADSSVNLIVRIWVNSCDYWPLKFDLTRRFKESFDAAGITIPFPQREVHLVHQAETPSGPLQQ
ncbi:MAG: mechanosensitive ion channel [Hyphomicrobiales bacterium]|nr:mechanosensitive ion channel [Hyphomicrobiales bacterium]